MYKAFHFDKIVDVYYRFKADGSLDKKASYDRDMSGRTYSNKIAYTHVSGTYFGIRACIKMACLNSITPQSHPVLYISSDSKVSRDVLRNDNYKITYSKDKADCIVLPYPKEENFKHNTCQALLCKDSTLYLFELNNHDYSPLTSEEKAKALDKVCEDYQVSKHELVYRDAEEPVDVIFVPNYEGWEEPLTTRTAYYQKKCCLDCDVFYDGSTAITPDTLLIWSRMEDVKMLEKAILNSNWKKYPVTLCIFLKKEKSYEVHRFGQQMDSVLQAINYDIYDRCNSLGGQLVSPEDWSMLQSYILFRLGTSNKGGFVDLKSTSPYGDFIKKKLAVAPKLISRDVSFSSLQQELKNNI